MTPVASRPFDLRAGRSLIIAEVAQSHDGSLGQAHAFIDCAADVGADAIKFQTHIAMAESTPSEPWRTRFSLQDATRYDYWKRMEFTEEQWTGLAAHARHRGIAFLSSPFSSAAVDLLTRVGVAAWKIGSGEVTNTELLRAVAGTKLPVLLSTGMSPWSEIDQAVEALVAEDLSIAVLQCTSEYPVAPERVGLNVLGELRRRYGRPVGLSDHSGTIYPSLAAATLGAEVIEVHLTLSRRMFGPDVPASVTPEQLATLIEGVRFVERANASPVDKDAVAVSLSGMRHIFMRSVVARTAMAKGHVLTRQDVVLKKPGTGIPAAQVNDVVGRRLLRGVEVDHLLTEDDFDPTGSVR